MDHFQKPLSYHNGVLMKALHTQVVPRYIQYMSAASEVNSILISHVQEKRHSRNELVRVHQKVLEALTWLIVILSLYTITARPP